MPGPRPLRADAERSVARILEAAERVLSSDPGASLERIAEAAGVARTTVHRRFSSRDELLTALIAVVNGRLRTALDTARSDAAPPLAALYQVTVVALELKVDWRFAMELTGDGSSAGAAIDPDILAGLDHILACAQESGLLRRDTNRGWVQRVYLALMHEAAIAATSEGSTVPERAGLVLDTLLRGAGTEELDLASLLGRDTPSRPAGDQRRRF